MSKYICFARLACRVSRTRQERKQRGEGYLSVSNTRPEIQHYLTYCSRVQLEGKIFNLPFYSSYTSRKIQPTFFDLLEKNQPTFLNLLRESTYFFRPATEGERCHLYFLQKVRASAFIFPLVDRHLEEADSSYLSDLL